MKIYYDSKLAKSLLFGSFKTCMFFGVVLSWSSVRALADAGDLSSRSSTPPLSLGAV